MSEAICEKCLGTGHKVDSVALGKFYKAKRQKLKYTQAEVAEAMGIDKSTLCFLEQGKRLWSSYYAIRFEQALNLLAQ